MFLSRHHLLPVNGVRGRIACCTLFALKKGKNRLENCRFVASDAYVRFRAQGPPANIAGTSVVL